MKIINILVILSLFLLVSCFGNKNTETTNSGTTNSSQIATGNLEESKTGIIEINSSKTEEKTNINSGKIEEKIENKTSENNTKIENKTSENNIIKTEEKVENIVSEKENIEAPTTKNDDIQEEDVEAVIDDFFKQIDSIDISSIKE